MLALASPLGVSGQSQNRTGTDDVGAHLEVGPRLSAVRSTTELFIGGSILFGVPGPLDVGIGGAVLAGKNQIPGDAAGSDLELGVGYAGIQLRHWGPGSGAVEWGVGLLVGAGNAKVSLKAVDTEIAADNFGVIEPDFGIQAPLARMLTVSARLGYRLAYGVEDLPEIGRDQLQGLTFSAGVSFGPF